MLLTGSSYQLISLRRVIVEPESQDEMILGGHEVSSHVLSLFVMVYTLVVG